VIARFFNDSASPLSVWRLPLPGPAERRAREARRRRIRELAELIVGNQRARLFNIWKRSTRREAEAEAAAEAELEDQAEVPPSPPELHTLRSNACTPRNGHVNL
jgi:hypothetical protein